MVKLSVPTIRKVKKWLGIASIVTGGLGTVLAPIIIMYIEYAPQVRKARGEAEASVESLAPAIVELQEIVTKGQVWASETNVELRSLEINYTNLDRRLIRCETYMEMLGQRRNLPRLPDKATLDFSGSMSIVAEPPGSKYSAMQIPQYKVPTTINKAQEKAAARKEHKCKPNDPLCGE